MPRRPVPGPGRFARALLLVPLGLPGQDIERLQGPPLDYDAPASGGAVERLDEALARGAAELSAEGARGRLEPLLDYLGIRTSSQVLVFSKTSLQADWIEPQNPRAVYFGDEAYVGWIPGAPFLEVASVTAAHGPVFYRLSQEPDVAPRFVRRDGECLSCHGGPMTGGWPGLVVRSVHPSADGPPINRSGTEVVDQSTPLEERWGGWYVTGTSPAPGHLGNAFADARTERVDPSQGWNATELPARVTAERYPTPHSDIVALMVLEHQTEMHNRIATAGYEVRLALQRQAERNRLFERPADERTPSTARILLQQRDRLLEHLLFQNEARLTGPVSGTSTFAAEFAADAPRDGEGRALKDLDLAERLLRHPCSWLIYSAAWDGLPRPLLDEVYAELWAILNRAPAFDEYSRLSLQHRRAIRAILLATKEGLPAEWR